MLSVADPPTVDQALPDLAKIFAAAILRLNARRRLPEKITLKLSESSPDCLEFSGETRLNGTSG